MATIYINPSHPFDGDGTSPETATAPGGVGARNVAVTSPTAGNTYSYARGSRARLGATSITVAANGITLTAHGSGAKPIIDAENTASFAVTIATANNTTITDLALVNGANANATLNIGGTSDTTAITDVDVSSQLGGCILAAGAGVTNLTLLRVEAETFAANNIGVNLSHTGAGTNLFKDSNVYLRNADRSQSNSIALAVRCAPAVIDNVSTYGGNVGIEARTTDGHLFKGKPYSPANGFETTISYCGAAGFRVRDSSNNVFQDYEIHHVWNGLPYNGGAGAGSGGGLGNAIDMLDVSGNCGNNVARRVLAHDVYQVVVDQSDNVGGNKFIAILGYDYIVNGINYQADAPGEGLIAFCAMLHHPSDPVLPAGHGFVVQQVSVSTTYRIVNNICVSDMPADGTNVQCVSLPLSANVGAGFVDYNNWFCSNGGVIGVLGVTAYTTLAAWQTALAGDVDTTGDDAHSRSVDPLWAGGLAPNSAEGFRLLADSAMRRAGLVSASIDPMPRDLYNRTCRLPPDLGPIQYRGTEQ